MQSPAAATHSKLFSVNDISSVAVMLLLIFRTVSLRFPAGLLEALLPISGCDLRRERVCFRWCQALMFKYAWLKQTLFHTRIWLYRGWCSWLFNLSESFLDSTNTEILSVLCCLLSRSRLSNGSLCIKPQLKVPLLGVVSDTLHMHNGTELRNPGEPVKTFDWLSINSLNVNIQGLSSPSWPWQWTLTNTDHTNLLLTVLDKDHRTDCSSGMKEFRSLLPETNSK